MYENIQDSSVCIIFLSNEYIRSYACLLEIFTATYFNVPIIKIELDKYNISQSQNEKSMSEATQKAFLDIGDKLRRKDSVYYRFYSDINKYIEKGVISEKRLSQSFYNTIKKIDGTEIKINDGLESIISSIKTATKDIVFSNIDCVDKASSSGQLNYTHESSDPVITKDKVFANKAKHIGYILAILGVCLAILSISLITKFTHNNVYNNSSPEEIAIPTPHSIESLDPRNASTEGKNNDEKYYTDLNSPFIKAFDAEESINFSDAYETSESIDPFCENTDNLIEVKNEQEYTIRNIIRYNGNINEQNTISSVKLSILIPDFSSDSINVKSIISTADSPGVEYTGNISFISKGQNFHLEYIPNSARIFSDVFGPEGRVLTDDVINNWALVGYDNLNGIISNDENCISIVTVNVKVVFDVQFEIEHMVRREGDDKWVQSVEANIGDNIEFLIFYTNTSDSTQNNVVLK